jgi:hypothetical protein
MPKIVARGTRRQLAPELIRSDVNGAIQDALAALADLERRYQERRASLDRWADRGGAKQRLLQALEVQHRKDRQPLVQQLADLHQRMMSATMFRTLH